MTPAVLLQQCAPAVAPVTMAAIVQRESGGNPLVLHDNTTGKSYQPRSVADAARIARKLIDQGHSVDIGLAQINSNNLPGMGLDADKVLDPCTNLRAAQIILLRGWKQSGGDLRGVLAAYNTGSAGSSLGEKYATSVYSKAGVIVPAIPGGTIAKWALADAGKWFVEPAQAAELPPVRGVVTWTPQSSPLSPQTGGLKPKW
ncbi:MAG: lytic transglycosylase domain-containing protein [Betaproteobacteria bacterium]|nr:lytic transglycosylase domain-containing protein [Betaproteobacteria bacterium]